MGVLGPLWGALGVFLGLFGETFGGDWASLGSLWGVIGPLWGHFWGSLGLLGPPLAARGHQGPSDNQKKPFFGGGLGLILGAFGDQKIPYGALVGVMLGYFCQKIDKTRFSFLHKDLQ